jgi:phosphocarrier protein
MIEITHKIKDVLGMHARPAGQLVKQCGIFDCDIKIGTAANMVDAKRVMGVMSLVLKHGDELKMTFNGTDESHAAEALTVFLAKSL